jgi:stage V sporulation protein AD
VLKGHQTWFFPSQPAISASASVVGPFEGKGPLANDFDRIHGDTWIGQDSWEKAEKRLLEEACEIAIEKAGLEKENVQFFIGGDLMSQLISASFTARTLSVPFLGVFGACSTSMESLALSALLVDSGNAETVLCGTCSHNSSVEKTFRYPTEYGGQKPSTAQWSVTGAGACVIQTNENKSADTGLYISAATIGRVVDMGLADPFNMGAAMAPAAVDTIEAHFRDTQTSFADFDLVITGDLGRVGYSIAFDLMKKHGLDVTEAKFADCGILIYGDNPTVLAGGSGAACSATVTYGHIFKRMMAGELNKVLVAATGALLSMITVQQKETIPCTCHAVVIERRGGT